MRIVVLLFVTLLFAVPVDAAAPAAVPKAAPAAARSPAPDPLSVANDNYRVAFENDQVRVLEHTVAMNGAEPAHRMPCRVTYAMAQGGYKLVTQAPGGPRRETVHQARDAWWSGAEEFALKNSGNAIARELIVEFKQPLPGANDCTSVGTLAVISIPPTGLSWNTDAAKIARASVLGDPAVAGPFVQRVKLPAGYKSGKRAFDRELSATVLGGELKVSLGEGVAVQTLPAGSYLRIPAGVVYEESSDRGAELELRGVGPLVAAPSDQPPKAP
jgi:hypothetical protein